ncbi:MAG: hypothetical protein K2K58_11440 [Muribaculaceae bacterium]|nr:hypothetical protein [Muribaculaceae bacterium]
MLIKDIIKYTSIITLLIFSSIALSSCGGNEEAEPDTPLGSTLTLSFNLDTFSTRSSSGSLNADNHPEEEEIDKELTIYNDWLHVYVHDAETNDLIFHITDKVFSPLGSIIKEQQSDGSYKVKVNTRSLTAGKKYRLSVMANCQDKGGNIYNVDSSFQNDDKTPRFLQEPHFMPYAGFTTFTAAASGKDNITQEIGTLWLLRSVARVEVRLSEDMQAKWEIKKAVLPDFGQKLYGFSYASPSLENIKNLNDTESLTMSQMFNPHTVRMSGFSEENSDIEMKDVNKDGSYFRIYLPEQHNPLQGATEEEIFIKLTLRNLITDQTVDAKLYIRDESANTLNIVRNHIYRYTVKTIKPLFDVDVAIIQPETKTVNVPSFD